MDFKIKNYNITIRKGLLSEFAKACSKNILRFLICIAFKFKLATSILVDTIF